MANVLPSGLRIFHVTEFVCPMIVCRCVPVLVSHNRMVLSCQLPLTSVLSGPNVRLETVPVCPVKVFICAPVSAFHRRMVLSDPPLATVCPSALSARLYIPSSYRAIDVWVRIFWIVYVAVFHKHTEFLVALASVQPLVLKTRLRTLYNI